METSADLDWLAAHRGPGGALTREPVPYFWQFRVPALMHWLAPTLNFVNSSSSPLRASVAPHLDRPETRPGRGALSRARLLGGRATLSARPGIERARLLSFAATF